MRLDRLITLNLIGPLRSAFGLRSSVLRPPSSVLGRRSLAPRLPILMYHSISDDPEPSVHPYYRVCTSPSRFAEHMRWLKQSGYRGVTLTEGLTWLQNGPSPVVGSPVVSGPRSGDRPVALTFDDGFQDFHTTAFPILQQHGFSATMFLPTAFIEGRESQPSPPRAGRGQGEVSNHLPFIGKKFLSWNQVRELHAAGIEFGSHTVNHPKLVDLDWPEIQSEISNSKSEIESRLQAPVALFCYPYAFPEQDWTFVMRLHDLLRQTGYIAATTTQIGRLRPMPSHFFLPRLPANSDDDAPFFLAKLAGHYDWLAIPQAIIKKLKRALRPARKTERPTARPVSSAP